MLRKVVKYKYLKTIIKGGEYHVNQDNHDKQTVRKRRQDDS